MSGKSQDGHHAVSLAEAAERLGLSRDALRMRIRRGKAKGFKRGRQLYVWLKEAPPETPPAAPRDSLPMAVDIQRQEIARLIAETERLNARLDRHLDETRDLRLMLQREQVLRQQEQSLRQDVQRLLERLLAHPALLGPAAVRPKTVPPHRQAERRGEAPDLAEMLKDIGQSLREMEARDPAPD